MAQRVRRSLIAALALVAAAPPDRGSDRRRLEQACDRGDGEACERLGAQLLVVPRGRRRAIAALMRSCDLDRASACHTVAEILGDEDRPDLPGALRFYRRGCELGDGVACREIVFGWATTKEADRLAGPDDARAALAVLERECRAGARTACRLLADFAGRGVKDVMATDIPRARALTEQSCQQGDDYACQLIALLRAEPPSEDDADDVREHLIRELLAQRRYEGVRTSCDARPFCVALASEGDVEGTDPPAVLLVRFNDVPAVRPASWCRSHEQGDIVALGPVARPSSWPPADGLVAWYVFYAWYGHVSSAAGRFVKKDSAWVREFGAAGLPDAPSVDIGDRSADRERVVAVVTPFVEAWNRGDPVLPGAPAGFGSDPESVSARHREHTRVEVDPVSIELSLMPRASDARVRLSLTGIFESRPGLLWPIEPWKQAGARTSVEVMLERTDGWWRVGDWRIAWIQTPWSVPRLYR